MSQGIEALIQSQVDAYNARDLKKFCSHFSAEIQTFSFPNTLVISGIDSFTEFYATQRFNHPNLSCKLIHRVVKGNKVIDHEVINYGETEAELVAIYEVEDNLIRRVTFIK